MKRHDSNLWRAHNQDMARNAEATAQAADTIQRSIKSVNKKRAAETEKAEAAASKKRRTARDHLLALRELKAAVSVANQ